MAWNKANDDFQLYVDDSIKNQSDFAYHTNFYENEENFILYECELSTAYLVCYKYTN